MENLKKKRLVAFIIDALIAILLSLVLEISLNTIGIWLPSMIIAAFVCFILLCKDCYNGMSVGRHLMKIQVLDSKTLKVASPTKCIIRNYFYSFWIIEFIVFLCNSKGLRVGDYVTSTKVVHKTDKRQEVNFRKIIVPIAIVFLIFTATYIYAYLSHNGKSLFGLILS